MTLPGTWDTHTKHMQWSYWVCFVTITGYILLTFVAWLLFSLISILCYPQGAVLGTFTLSYETTPHGLQFFGDVKTLIVLEAPVVLFPQPTFAEQSYNQMQKGERDVLTKR